jgi:hypothetical protein
VYFSGSYRFLKAKELLYPNPVENILNLKLPENKNTVTLYDFSGKKLFEKNVGTTLDLDFSSFTAGTYLIKIENSKGANTYKIVKK